MQSSIHSPVPKEQIPHEEFIQISSSIFFSWPKKGSVIFFRNLILSWSLSFPLFLIICTGSYSIKGNITKLIFVSFISSIIIPLFILLRQFLGWKYIYNRLVSHYIFYEESDWHDGQVWEKPELWKDRDSLIASQEVSPILSVVRNFAIYLLLVFLFSLASFTYLSSTN